MKKIATKTIKKEEPARMDAIEKLTILNGNMVQKISELSAEIDTLKSRIAQVASRLGI